MKLHRRHWILGVLALLVAAAATLLSAIAPSLLQSKLIDLANGAGVRLSLQQFSPGWRSLHAEQLNIFVPRVWSAFVLQDVNVRFAPLSLPAVKAISDWPANPALVFDARGYGGSLEGSGGCALPNCNARLKLRAVGLELSQHPQVEALGVESGTADIDLTAALGSSPEEASGNADLKVAKLSSADAMNLSGRLLGLPQDLPIPRIEGLNCSITAELKQLALTIRAEVREPNLLGTLSANGVAQLTPQLRIEGAVLDVRADFVDQAANSFNTFRQLIPDAKQPAPNTELNTQKRWAIHVDTGKHPRFQIDPLP